MGVGTHRKARFGVAAILTERLDRLALVQGRAGEEVTQCVSSVRTNGLDTGASERGLPQERGEGNEGPPGVPSRQPMPRCLHKAEESPEASAFRHRYWHPRDRRCPVFRSGRPRHGDFSNTATWLVLSAVNGVRCQLPHRFRSRKPAIVPIRSSSDGQT